MNTPGTLKDARRRKELALASLRELQLKEREGELVSRTAVERLMFATARSVRDNLLNIPDRVAGQYASLRDQSQIHGPLDQGNSAMFRGPDQREGQRQCACAASAATEAEG